MKQAGREENAALRKENRTKTLIQATVGASFLTMQYGYNLWIVYSPSVLMQDFYNITSMEDMKDPENAKLLMFVAFALYPLGAIVGALLVGSLVDTFGRKGALMITGFLSLVSSVLMWSSSLVKAFEYTLVARLYTGIITGIISGVVPMYIGEISPRNLRGAPVVMSWLFMTVGVVLAQIASLHEILGTHKGWPILKSLAGLMPLFQLILLCRCPESPRYLMIQKRDEQSAREALKKLRERENVEDEIEELRQEDLAEKTEKMMTVFRLLSNSTMRWHVITTVVLMGGQQLSGINAAYYYTEKIYVSTNVGLESVRFITISSTALLCISISVSMTLVDTMGRRILLLVGFGICAIICVLITMTLEMQDTVPQMNYISTILVDTFLFAHTLAAGPVIPLVIVELYLQSTRSSGFVIAGFVQWFLNFLTGVSFYYIEMKIGPYSFLIFWPICVATFIYIFKVLPETKNRTFVDVRRLMAIQTARKIQVKGPAGK